MSAPSFSPGGSLSPFGSVATSPLSPIHSFGMEQTKPATLNISALFQGAPWPHPQRCGRYYFDDGNVIFLVEDTLYNVHRYFFQRDSPSFASIFSLGLKDDEPLPLTGVTVGDFDLFLSILYPADFGLYTATTVDDWAAILGLAAKWNFRSIKVLAIKQLDLIASPIDKVVLGRKHHIVEWLPNAYSAICERREALTLEEGIRLGMEDVIKIAAVRQGQCSPNFVSTKQVDVLKKTFGLPDVSADVDLHTDAATQTGDNAGLEKSGPRPEGQQLEGTLGGGGGGGGEQCYKEGDVACCRAICKSCGLEGVCNVWPFCDGFEHGRTCACTTARKYPDGREDDWDSLGTPHADDDCSCTLCRRTTTGDRRLPIRDGKKREGKR